MSLFPMIQPEASASPARELPVYREVAWDFENDVPLYQNGEPVIVERGEAILVWAWNALRTVRFRHEIFTTDYGCEAENLIGQGFSPELKQSEAARYVRECLLVNPYIKEVNDIEAVFQNDRLEIACTIVTIYGTISLKGDSHA